MYDARKTNAITEDAARIIAGDEAVDDVLAANCDFTSRLIDDIFNVAEMSATTTFIDKDGDERFLTVLYLVDKDDLEAAGEDLGSLNYDDRTFEII